MEQLILDYLNQHWSAEHAQKLNFSPVPKGQPGDLAVNFFALTKELGKNPLEIGQIVGAVLEGCPLLQRTEQAGPYLNLFFSVEEFFHQALTTPLEVNVLQKKKIVVEYSSPNTNKPLHLGHMRNHAIGISVSNLLEASGGDIIRTCIINDRGIHICKSMLAYQQFGNGATPESTGKKSDHFVGDYYVRYDQESKKDSSLAQQAQAMLRAWEEEEKEVRKLWEQMNRWTLEGHDQTYERQGIFFDKRYYESDTYKLGREFAMKGLEDGHFYKKDGAVWIDLTDEGLDEKVIVRSDGTTIYVTQDLATTYYRHQDFDFEEHIWITADEQNYHFQVLIACLDKLGILPKDHLYHLGYGLVNLPDGRMKSREGTVVDADTLMDELSGIAQQEIQKRNPELTEAQQHETAEIIMDGAWKFFLLKTSPNKTITFDAEKSIDFQGATGPYLQYAGVRIKSIFEKAGVKMSDSSKLDFGAFTDSEKSLGVKILEWPKVLSRSAEAKNPTLIATYLLELAQVWSSFYADNSVLGAETPELKTARLALAAKVYAVLEKGLSILGIKIPEQM